MIKICMYLEIYHMNKKKKIELLKKIISLIEKDGSWWHYPPDKPNGGKVDFILDL